MTSDLPAEGPFSVGAALGTAASSGWASLVKGVLRLAGSVQDPAVRGVLIRSMNDSDTAVIEAPTDVLVRAGGLSGTRDVLEQLAISDDDAGYHIDGRIAAILLDGYPVVELAEEQLPPKRSEP